MPIFDYKCENCQNEEKDEFVHRFDATVVCSKCGNVMTKLPCFPNVQTFPSDGVFLEHVSPEGETFRSRKDMLDYEKTNDIYIDCAH